MQLKFLIASIEELVEFHIEMQMGGRKGVIILFALFFSIGTTFLLMAIFKPKWLKLFPWRPPALGNRVPAMVWAIGFMAFSFVPLIKFLGPSPQESADVIRRDFGSMHTNLEAITLKDYSKNNNLLIKEESFLTVFSEQVLKSKPCKWHGMRDYYAECEAVIHTADGHRIILDVMYYPSAEYGYILHYSGTKDRWGIGLHFLNDSIARMFAQKLGIALR